MSFEDDLEVSLNKFILCERVRLQSGAPSSDISATVVLAAAARGLSTHVLCGAGAEFPSGPAEFHPVYAPDSPLRDTELALLHLGAGRADHLLSPLDRPDQLRDWLDYVAELPRYRLDTMPALHLWLCFPPEALEQELPAVWSGLKRRLAARKAILSGHLHLCAQNAGAARRYAAQLGLPVSAAPAVGAPKRGRGRQAGGADKLVAHLLRHAPALPPRHGATILFVTDGDALLRGSDHGIAARRLLDYLFAAGHSVTALFAASDIADGAPARLAWARRLDRQLRDLPFEGVYCAAINPADGDGLPYQYLSGAGGAAGTPMRRRLRLAEALTIPSALLRQIRHGAPDAILIDDLAYATLAEALGVDAVPTLCRARGLYAPRQPQGDPARPHNDAALRELALLGQCDYLLAACETETGWMRSHLPAVPCVTLPPGLELAAAAAARLAGHADLAAVLVASGLRGALTAAQLARIESFTDRLDILCLGDDGAAVRHFIDKVFLPLLAPQGVTMLVLGEAGLDLDWAALPGLLVVDALDSGDLGGLYAAARVCLVAAGEGQGGGGDQLTPHAARQIAVALAHGKPVLTNAAALDGLSSELVPHVLAFGRPAPLAKALLRLLASRPARERHLRQLGQALLASECTHGKLLDQAFAALAGLQPARPEKTAAPAKLPPAIEWDAQLRLANRLLLGWLAPAADNPAPVAPLPSGARLSTLKRLLLQLLPAYLDGAAATGVAAAARARLLLQPKAAVAQLLELALPGARLAERGAGRFASEVLVSGAARNTVVVHLKRLSDTAPAPQFGLRVGGALVPTAGSKAGAVATFHADLPTDPDFPFLQRLRLEAGLGPDSGWQIDAVLLREEIGIAALVASALSAPGFYPLERDPDGKPFAWTRAQSLVLDLPFWRGSPKVLLVEAAAMRNNRSQELLLGGVAMQPHGELAAGMSICELSADAGYPFPRALSFACHQFEALPAPDRRLTGIGLRSVSAISTL